MPTVGSQELQEPHGPPLGVLCRLLPGRGRPSVFGQAAQACYTEAGLPPGRLSPLRLGLGIHSSLSVLLFCA